MQKWYCVESFYKASSPIKTLCIHINWQNYYFHLDRRKSLEYIGKVWMNEFYLRWQSHEKFGFSLVFCTGWGRIKDLCLFKCLLEKCLIYMHTIIPMFTFFKPLIFLLFIPIAVFFKSLETFSFLQLYFIAKDSWKKYNNLF